MANEIWTLTTLSDRRFTGTAEERRRAASGRCWGYYFDKEKALQSALGSADFFSECGYYTHIVIERVEEGCMSFDLEPIWIELRQLTEPIIKSIKDDDGEEVEYRQEFEAVMVDKPEWACQIVSFGIG